MTPYFFIYGFVAAGVSLCFLDDAPIRRVVQNYYLVLLMFALAIFAGMRSPTVDRDFGDYVVWFDLIKAGNAPLFAWLRDPAFACMSWVVAQLGFSYSLVAFLYALLGVAATWRFAAAVSAQRWVTLLFYLLFCQYFMVLEMTEIRAAVAIPLMGLALYQASLGKRRTGIWTYLVALVFHFSVIVALPLLIMLLAGARFRTRAWLYWMIAAGIVASVAMRSIINLLSGLYRLSEYLNGGAEEHDLRVISWYALAHLVFILVPTVFLWKRLTRHQRMATLACSLGLLFFVVFGWNTGLATRLLYIFDIYWLLIMMMILEVLHDNGRVIYVGFLTLTGLALFWKSLTYMQPYSALHPWDAMLRPLANLVAVHL